MLRRVLVALGLGALCLSSCAGETPNSGIGVRTGARGRISGYLYDADTGAPLTGATVETLELGAKVTTTTTDGLFSLDTLTAGGQYRVTFTNPGFVPRFTTLSIAQVPSDAYDAVPTSSVGAIAMVKPTGAVRGRVEFAAQTSGQAAPIANANIVMDFQNTFPLTKTTTTNAQGEFSLDGLPASPSGLAFTLCAYNLAEGTDPVADFVPTCAVVNLFSNQTTPVTIRPNRFDLSNSDVNLVQGVVRDVLTRLPIEGVDVFEVGKEAEKVTTDANGFYLLKTTSVNRFSQFTYRKTGYSEGYTEFNLTRGANNQNTNVSLYPGGASIEGRLVYANLVPAANAEVRVDLRTLNTSFGVNVLQSVKTDAQGNFTLTNLPGAADGLSVRLNVTPWSADPELFPETRNQNVDVVLYPGARTPAFAALTSQALFSLVASNFSTGFINPTEPMTLLVSLPTVPAENLFVLRDATQGATMPFSVTYSDSNRRITITPTGAPSSGPLWSEARQYSLTYTLRANNAQLLSQVTTSNITPRTSLTSANIASRISALTVDTPDIDATSRSFTLRWPPLPDAFSYSLYVKTQNTNRVPSYVRLVANIPANIAPSTAVVLPGNAGPSLEPLINAPFGLGQVLTFLVVPVDARGIETDASKGATLDLRDVVPPRIELGIAQLDGASGAAHPIRFLVRSSELMDRNTPPTLSLPSGLTYTSWTIDETQGGLEGTLTLTGSLSSVANLSVQPRDTSGNLGKALAIPVLQSALVPNQNFEGDTAGTCSASGWTLENFVSCTACPQLALPSTAAATPAIPGTLSAFDGICALGFGDPDATWCGVQQASAPLDLTGTAFDRRTVSLQLRAWPYWVNGATAQTTPSMRCDFFDPVTNVTIAPLVSSTNLSSFQSRVWVTPPNLINTPVSQINLTGQIGRAGKIRCFLETASCGGVRGGLQLDDFRVYLK